MNKTTEKHAAIVNHILLSGFSFKKIELKIAVANGIKLIIIKVFATLVCEREIINVALAVPTNAA